MGLIQSLVLLAGGFSFSSFQVAKSFPCSPNSLTLPCWNSWKTGSKVDIEEATNPIIYTNLHHINTLDHPFPSWYLQIRSSFTSDVPEKNQDADLMRTKKLIQETGEASSAIAFMQNQTLTRTLLKAWRGKMDILCPLAISTKSPIKNYRTSWENACIKGIR